MLKLTTSLITQNEVVQQSGWPAGREITRRQWGLGYDMFALFLFSGGSGISQCDCSFGDIKIRSREVGATTTTDRVINMVLIRITLTIAVMGNIIRCVKVRDCNS